MSKKKTIIGIVIMVLLLTASIVGYLLVDRFKQQEEEAVRAEQASLQLLSFNTDDAQTVEFTLPEGHFRTVYEDGTWVLQETDYEHTFELNPYYIITVVNYMADLRATEKITAPAERLSAYGLDDPVTVSCTASGKTYTALFGSASATEECWYVMMPDSDLVYCIDYSRGETLHGGVDYIKSRYMLDYLDAQITGFKLEQGSTTILDLTKPSGLWEIRAPKTGARTDSAQINSMMTSLSRFEVDAFEGYDSDPEALKRCGMDKPAYTMTVQADKDVTTLEFAPRAEGGMYMHNKETGQLSRVSEGVADYFGIDPLELMEKQLLLRPFEEAKSLEVTVDDLHFTMEMNAETGTYKIDGRDLSGMSDNVLRLYQNLYDTVAGLDIDSLDLGGKEPDAEQEYPCEFRFTMQDGSTTVLSLRDSKTENLYWADVDGKYTGTTIRRRSLTSNTGVLNFYEKLMDAIEDET